MSRLTKTKMNSMTKAQLTARLMKAVNTKSSAAKKKQLMTMTKAQLIEQLMRVQTNRAQLGGAISQTGGGRKRSRKRSRTSSSGSQSFNDPRMVALFTAMLLSDSAGSGSGGSIDPKIHCSTFGPLKDPCEADALCHWDYMYDIDDTKKCIPNTDTRKASSQAASDTAQQGYCENFKNDRTACDTTYCHYDFDWERHDANKQCTSLKDTLKFNKAKLAAEADMKKISQRTKITRTTLRQLVKDINGLELNGSITVKGDINMNSDAYKTLLSVVPGSLELSVKNDLINKAFHWNRFNKGIIYDDGTGEKLYNLKAYYNRDSVTIPTTRDKEEYTTGTLKVILHPLYP